MVVGRLVERAAQEMKERWSEGDFTTEVEYEHPDGYPWDQATFRGDAYLGYGWGVACVEVEGDKLTNEVKTLGVWSSHEIGKAIDELIVHGQINGGILQSLGYGSMEKLEVKGGRFKQKSMSDYVIPTSMDFPKQFYHIQENPYPWGPYGAKGMGELVFNGASAAYVDAVERALNVPSVRMLDKYGRENFLSLVRGLGFRTIDRSADHYGLSYRQIGLVTGPSHAEEVSRGKLSYLTVVCADPENARRIGERFAGENICFSYSADLYGVEYAAILKNIYALSVGIAVGLGYGDNFLAVLIANAAGEMTRFLEESYPDERNTQVSAYLGDLLVTCYSTYSRNRRLGLLIGHGCTVKSALNEMTMVAEGYFAADCIRHINFRHRVDMPIADMVYRVLYEGASARRCMQELTTKLI